MGSPTPMLVTVDQPSRRYASDTGAIPGQPCLSRTHQYLAREGEKPGYVHLLQEGWAARYKLLPDGRRQIVSVYLPGDLCDPSWIMVDRASHPIVALTPLRSLRVARHDLAAAAARDAGLMSALWSEACIASAIQDEWILNLGRKNATERLGHLLCELFHRVSTTAGADRDICELPLTQIELADITGLTPVHVNRVLQDMRAAGLVELGMRRLRLPDPTRLARLALFNPEYLGSGRQRRSIAIISAAA